MVNKKELNEKDVERFNEILTSTEREGMDRLIEKFLKKTDFYAAPASAKNYDAYPGGLIKHCLNVYDRMMFQAETEGTLLNTLIKGGETDIRSVAIIALLHDVYKANHFSESCSNKQNRDPEYVEAMRAINAKEVKSDSVSEFVWTPVKSYTVEDPLPLGNTEKSIIFLMKYLDLKWDEIVAIRWTNGPGQKDMNDFAEAVSKYPLVMALYEAKLEAMLIDSKRN